MKRSAKQGKVLTMIKHINQDYFNGNISLKQRLDKLSLLGKVK